jgi:hypothetical protein
LNANFYYFYSFENGISPQGWTEQYSNWEPKNNLDCHRLIKKFERARAKANAAGTKARTAKKGKEPMKKKAKTQPPPPPVHSLASEEMMKLRHDMDFGSHFQNNSKSIPIPSPSKAASKSSAVPSTTSTPATSIVNNGISHKSPTVKGSPVDKGVVESTKSSKTKEVNALSSTSPSSPMPTSLAAMAVSELPISPMRPVIPSTTNSISTPHIATRLPAHQSSSTPFLAATNSIGSLNDTPQDFKTLTIQMEHKILELNDIRSLMNIAFDQQQPLAVPVTAPVLPTNLQLISDRYHTPSIADTTNPEEFISSLQRKARGMANSEHRNEALSILSVVESIYQREPAELVVAKLLGRFYEVEMVEELGVGNADVVHRVNAELN